MTTPPPDPPRGPIEWLRSAQDVIAFAAGLIGMGWQTVIERNDRSVLIGAFLAMMGLPFVRELDRRAKKRRDEDEDTGP